ncbi:PLP-dependent aminotransferase family protein [Sodalis sp. dw_96]|uniref:aminotransferase-like domain-containing protein n=1 Tax=Sodalis sp. dw_96 TaxID=2719794 RepID=UPI001BD611D5|nr:PLP-dependent aminotransferase family protein [Sodalis sp. dw_96]
MGNNQFDASTLFRAGLPVPAPAWQGLPRYVFNSGHNDPDLIPLEGLAQAAQRVILREGKSLAVYNQANGPQGYPALRQFVSNKLKNRGISAGINDILITSGSGQAIDLVNNLLLEPGDTVLVEEFSYIGALRKLRAKNINIVGIPLDEQGIRTDKLEELLASLATRHITPKYIYTIPTVQNPTGAILGLARRRQLISLAEKYRTLIFEDECYADIIWSGEAPPALFSLQPDRVIHISSFSKSLAPSVRVAYLTAAPAILSQIVALKNDGGTGALDQMIVAEYFTEHFADHISALTLALRHKLDILRDVVQKELGDIATLWLPQGGIFLWVKLPDYVDTRELVAPAEQLGISFNPGSDWAADAENGKNWLRLCFALAGEQELIDGVTQLAALLRSHTAIARTGQTLREPA